MLLRKNLAGATLLEMMLVAVIIGSLSMLGVRYLQMRATQLQVARAAMQMQDILNAASIYFVNTSTLPTSVSDLQASPGYLPSKVVSPWGTPYVLTSNFTNGVISVSIYIPNEPGPSVATQLAGQVPMGTISTNGSLCTPTTGKCKVTAQMTLPSQSLNSAQAVNFVNLYHHGACVPAPVCPGWDYTNNVCLDGSSGSTADCMQPTIFVVPVSVSGFNNGGSTGQAYPISSFTAIAYGGPTALNYPINGSPGSCLAPTTGVACGGSDINTTTTAYWRVCLKITTTKGALSKTSPSNWGDYVEVIAITRCAPLSQSVGSDFTVFL